MRHLDVRPLLGAVVCAALLGVIGLRPGDALLVGLVTLVVGVVMVAGRAAEQNEWPDAEPEETVGARREVSALTWSFFGVDGRVAEPAVRRLRAVAVRRLARRGVVLPNGLRQRQARSDPAPPPRTDPADDALQDEARALLGERAWTILTAPGGWLPSLQDVAHCVEVIERLTTAQSVERPRP